MTFKRTIIGLVLAILVLVIPSACGSGNNAKPNANTGTTTQNGTSGSSTQNGTAANGGANTANPGGNPGNAADPAQATALFKQNCVVCHGVNLEGGVGPNLQKVGASLSKDRIVAQITNGGGGMPAFKGKLSDSQINVLADWLSSKK